MTLKSLKKSSGLSRENSTAARKTAILWGSFVEPGPDTLPQQLTEQGQPGYKRLRIKATQMETSGG